MSYQMPDLPGSEGLLPEPIPAGNGVEVVRRFERRLLSAALFDLDGTLSNERLGWPDLMVAVNASFLTAETGGSLSVSSAYELVLRDVEGTIGVPTYVQMRRLTDMIADHGAGSSGPSPQLVKDVYTSALTALVSERRAAVRKGATAPETLAVPGAGELLRRIAELLPESLYLASGTDVEAVLESVEILRLNRFFPRRRVIAAGSLGPEDCAKEHVVRRLVGELGTGSGIVTFGDGFPELVHTYRTGGIAIGVLTPDASSYAHMGYFTVEKKRRRLLDAGAHILVSRPFEHVPGILALLERGHG